MYAASQPQLQDWPLGHTPSPGTFHSSTWLFVILQHLHLYRRHLKISTTTSSTSDSAVDNSFRYPPIPWTHLPLLHNSTPLILHRVQTPATSRADISDFIQSTLLPALPTDYSQSLTFRLQPSHWPVKMRAYWYLPRNQYYYFHLAKEMQKASNTAGSEKCPAYFELLACLRAER